ncbi:MAG: hypothetical protein HY520_00755 [Candidatus Aenigmarchaeota archaeon]|nr:hypothetical protein [Candidatus Aenigmarchaeota archaeon]
MERRRVVRSLVVGIPLFVVTAAFLTVIAAPGDSQTPAYKSWLFTGQNLYTTGSSVGIGTPTPGAALEIQSTNPAEQLEVRNPATGSQAHSYIAITTGDTGPGIYNGLVLGYNAGGLAFLNSREYAPLALATNDIERFRITADGNIGIGTSSPLRLLHLSSGGVGSAIARIEGGPTGHAYLEFYQGTTDRGFVGWDAASGSAMRLVNKDNGPVAFSTTGQERMRIDSVGKVGIGTTSPDRLLHLQGGSLRINHSIAGGAAQILLSNPDNTDPASDAYMLVEVGGTSAGDPLTWYAIPGGSNWVTGIDNSDAGKFKTAFGTAFGTNDFLVIDTSGNVGIGTTTPQSALEVEGYIQLDLTAGAPPAADCDSAGEEGRMVFDPDADFLYICSGASGWVAK